MITKGRRVLALGGLAMAWLASSCGARTALYLDERGTASTAGSEPARGGASSAGQGGEATGGTGPCREEDDTSCGSGLICASGRCVPRCDTDANCPPSSLCRGGVCAVRASYVTAGDSHACVEVSDGSIHCWGDGSSGQLGNGASLASDVPVSVVGFPTALGERATELSAGGAFTCAWLGASGVQCWGSGAVGELGNGGSFASAVPIAARVVPAGLQHIASGFGHSCALLASGGVGCWGANYYGQLGDGTLLPRSDFSSVMNMPGGRVMQLSVGGTHSCVSIDDGGVLCWGDNRFMQLGAPLPASSPQTVFVNGLGDPAPIVSQIAAGGSHTCAMLTDRSVRCWGDNMWFQLGSDRVERSSEPLRVPNIPDGTAEVTQLCSGARHSCVLMTDGSVRCWGIGGALGNGSATASAVPVKVVGLVDDPARHVQKIACGGTTSCALIDDGTVRCWSDRVKRSLSF